MNHSPYSMIEGIPVALIGIHRISGAAVGSRWRASARVPLLASLVRASLFSLYLAHIERDILGVWCLYCVISLAIIAADPAARLLLAHPRCEQSAAQALVNLN